MTTPEDADDRRLRNWALGLAGACGAGAGLFVTLATPCQRMFREVGVNLPLSAECALAVLEALRRPPAYIVLLALIGLLLLPVYTGASAARTVRWLRLGALQSAGLWGAGLLAIVHGIAVNLAVTIQCLCPPGCRHMGDGRLVVLLPFLAVGLVQLRAWYELSCELVRLPRGGLGLELRRATFLALPVATVAALAAYEVAEAVPAGGGATLLVPPALAAAGTALVAALGAGLLVRTRAARAHES